MEIRFLLDNTFFNSKSENVINLFFLKSYKYIPISKDEKMIDQKGARK